ncbi:MAG: methylenetetrahydrofolate--tRNA-(uracil(54)-C(5))-methyltransferase (FADH(2)-oxidizing) TrmFO [Syntrophomonadaceae bacterium]
MRQVNIIGGGLAGCEAAVQIARAGIPVNLWEMRPYSTTPAHQGDGLAELVCSNSLKSEIETTAQGLLKKEMKMLGSFLLECAEAVRVPAGAALAVDREAFSRLVTEKILAMPEITLIRREVTMVPDDQVTIIATGPLTSPALSANLQKLTGQDNLYFYDAVAPSILASSVDMTRVFRASRYGKGSDDYLNCPMTREEYELFYANLINADIKEGHLPEEQGEKLVFEGCMPIEIMARRGKDTLRFGPMRPVGLRPSEEKPIPYAVVQLRQENRDGTILGLVGFQTRLRWGEQKRVFSLIPGLEQAEFVRYGVMHRNTFINSPKLLLPTLQLRYNPEIFLAGQITGVEGYMESAATGIVAGINAAHKVLGKEPVIMSPYTMIGALIRHITDSSIQEFQPINANFGILPSLDIPIKDKKSRYQSYTQRSIRYMSQFLRK